MHIIYFGEGYKTKKAVRQTGRLMFNYVNQYYLSSARHLMVRTICEV